MPTLNFQQKKSSPRYLIFLFIFAFLGSPSFAAIDSNQLKDHPSPYLALHGDDPVFWQKWNQETVQLARSEKKLLFLSSGYFSCHWCHVMQRESYKNDQVARFLNKYFVPVKIDRELEPALDARLIEFAQASRGNAGWPLNVFLTPEGHPVYAVTYLPTDQFHLLLSRLIQLWTQDAERITTLAKREAPKPETPGTPELVTSKVTEYLDTAARTLVTIGDKQRGGFSGARKFPMAPQLSLVMDYLEREPDMGEVAQYSQDLEHFLRLTLDQMATHGLIDHLAGGFFRYTVDPNWRIPHFEKMLYDNAQLSSLYIRAAQLFDEPRYRQIAQLTLDFMIDSMMTAEGALVASFSAVDDQDIEGGYYLWDEPQLSDVLTTEEIKLAKSILGMETAAPLEHGWLPLHSPNINELAQRLEMSAEQVKTTRTMIEQKLLKARVKRVLPVDNKLLAGWNGLALKAFVEAASSIDAKYETSARRIRDFLIERLWHDKELKRSWANGEIAGTASIEDYAFVGLGLFNWAEYTDQKDDYHNALMIIEQAWERFYDNGWRLSEKSLIATEPSRTLIQDGALPSPAATVAQVSLSLANKLDLPELRNRALSVLNTGHEQLARSGVWYATYLSAMMREVNVN